MLADATFDCGHLFPPMTLKEYVDLRIALMVSRHPDRKYPTASQRAAVAVDIIPMIQGYRMEARRG